MRVILFQKLRSLLVRILLNDVLHLLRLRHRLVNVVRMFEQVHLLHHLRLRLPYAPLLLREPFPQHTGDDAQALLLVLDCFRDPTLLQKVGAEEEEGIGRTAYVRTPTSLTVGSDEGAAIRLNGVLE